MSRADSWWERLDITSLRTSVPKLLTELSKSDGELQDEILYKILSHPHFNLEDAKNIVENHREVLKAAGDRILILFLSRLPENLLGEYSSRLGVSIDDLSNDEFFQDNKKLYNVLHELESGIKDKPKSEKSHWLGLQGVFSGSKGSRVLRRDYWPEAFSKGLGQMPTSILCGEETMKVYAYIWVNSNVNMSLYEWINEINKHINLGIIAEKILYLSESERELCRVRFNVDAKLTDLSGELLSGKRDFVIDASESIFIPKDEITQKYLNADFIDIVRGMLLALKELLKLSDEWIEEKLKSIDFKKGNKSLEEIYSEVEQKSSKLNISEDVLEKIMHPFVRKCEKIFWGFGAPRWHHSSFLSGAPVLFAGQIELIDGGVSSVSQGSGHYKPTDKNMATFLALLEKYGVDLDRVSIKSFDGKGVLNKSAKNWLENYNHNARHNQNRM